MFFLLFVLSNSSFVSGQDIDPAKVEVQVDSLILLSRQAMEKKAWEEAMEINGRAERLAADELGEHSMSFVKTLLNHGKVHDGLKEYTDAEECYYDAKSHLEEIEALESEEYFRSLLLIAYAKTAQNKFKEGIPFFLEGIQLQRNFQGGDSPDLARSMSNLG